MLFHVRSELIFIKCDMAAAFSTTLPLPSRTCSGGSERATRLAQAQSESKDSPTCCYRLQQELNRAAQSHSCLASARPQERKSLVYSFNNGKFDFYKIVEHQGSDMSVQRIVSESFKDEWLLSDQVRVFKYIFTPSGIFNLTRSAIAGKAIVVRGDVMTRMRNCSWFT